MFFNRVRPKATLDSLHRYQGFYWFFHGAQKIITYSVWGKLMFSISTSLILFL